MTDQFQYLSDFINEIDVACPHCAAHALVTSDKNNRANTRFSCAACGKSKQWAGQPGVIQTAGPNMQQTQAIALGIPFDCYFKYPLWYQIEFKANTFFAYNLVHLKFLKDYIQDPLRKRKEDEWGWRNASLQSRLPKWILSAGNRQDLLKKIAALEKK